MKKVIAILGSTALSATSISSFVAHTNNSNQNIDKYFDINYKESNVLFQNKIEKLIIINDENNNLKFENLVKLVDESIIFDQSSIDFQNLNTESKSILRSFDKTELEIVYQNFKIYNILKENNLKGFSPEVSTKFGKMSAENPRSAWEYLGGVWRLHFDHEFSLNLAGGLISAGELAAVLALILIFIPPAAAAAAVTAAFLIINGHLIRLEENGNGTLVRFAVWTIPNDIQPSYKKWK